MNIRSVIFIVLHICFAGKMLQAQNTYKRSDVLSRQLLQYDVNLYGLDLNLTNQSNYISGSGTIKATVTASKMDTFAFELHQNLIIDSIYINAKKYLVSSSRTNGEVQVKLQNALTKNDAIKAVIYYHGNPPATVNTWKLGLINEVDPKYGVKITHSLSVPYSAYEWWPCKQVITDLADSTNFYFTVDTSLEVASNGKIMSVRRNNKDSFKSHIWQYKSKNAINYYLVSVAVADFKENKYFLVETGKPSVFFQDYIYETPKADNDGKNVETVSKDVMRNHRDLFGNYPFEKYGIVSVPLSGGMEHQTMSAIGDITDKYLLAHEMAHQWWGDNVSLVSFRDMWLNEGFAKYAEYLTAEKLYPADAPGMMQNNHTNAMSKFGGSVYVSDTLVFDNLYDGRLVYLKGAAIIHTLRFLVNDDAKFFGALKSYQQKFSGKNVRLQDFKNTMETETGVNLDVFLRQWYYGQGYPTFALTWNQKDGVLKMRSIQTTSTTVTKVFKTPLELLVKRTEGDTIIKVFQDTNTNYFYVPIPGTVTGITIDPNNWILNKIKPVVHDINLSVPKSKKSSGYNFRIYPNPTQQKLYIDMPENALGLINEKLKIEITQLDGKVCLQQDFSFPKTELDITFLAAGIYFLSIKGENVNFREKVVKD
ncbi:MAG: T9SS type A sorting domain-containing protein [Sphingobacteriales bacterium]|nr:MAG: T9SS type A sorting domain-containing protein [Sphingobacteriales bacterium]